MKNRLFMVLLLAILLILFNSAHAEEAKSIQLPAPNIQGGKPIMEVLKARKTTREFSNKPVPLQTLSDLLWSGFGVNRPDSKGRTAPSAMNSQEIDIYIAMESGLYLYDPFKNTLEIIIPQDIRAITGKQEFVKEAPINLIYVADFVRAEKFKDRKEFYTACDTGFISQNVYLYCASSGLATVVRGWFDEEALSLTMKLKPTQKIILTQTVGYPK